MNRQLSGFGFKQCAGGPHNVAQIPVFEGVVNVLAHAFVVDVDLNAAA